MKSLHIKYLRILPIVLIALLLSNTGCSYYVYKSNQEYGYPINEIDKNTQSVFGCKLSNTFKFEKSFGHHHYRFTNVLKENDKNRTIDIYIPISNEVGQPIIEEVDELCDDLENDRVFLYVDRNNLSSKSIDDIRIKDYPIVVIGNSYIDKPTVSISFIDKGCERLSAKVCEREWHVKPNFEWVARNKLTFCALQSRYLLSVPVDAAVIGFFIIVTDIVDDD